MKSGLNPLRLRCALLNSHSRSLFFYFAWHCHKRSSMFVDVAKNVFQLTKRLQKLKKTWEQKCLLMAWKRWKDIVRMFLEARFSASLSPFFTVMLSLLQVRFVEFSFAKCSDPLLRHLHCNRSKLYDFSIQKSIDSLFKRNPKNVKDLFIRSDSFGNTHPLD